MLVKSACYLFFCNSVHFLHACKHPCHDFKIMIYQLIYQKKKAHGKKDHKEELNLALK
jgi:hypothetical protein